MKAEKGNNIKFDARNYRDHSDKNRKIIKRSLDEFGAGRSILIDSDNEIIAGNGVKEGWGDRPIKIIETDGSELIAIKRTDLKTSDEKRKQLALIDNHASDSSTFDIDLVQSDFDKSFLEDWDFEVKDGFFQRQMQNKEQYIEDRIPYPITIVVSKQDYDKWVELKRELGEDNDLKLFLKVLKTVL